MRGGGGGGGGGGGLERANQLTGFSMRVDDFMTFVQV